LKVVAAIYLQHLPQDGTPEAALTLLDIQILLPPKYLSSHKSD
jgi:hypothetical protein